MIVETYNIPNKDMGQITAWLLGQSFSSYYSKCESEGDIVRVFFIQTLAGVDKQALDDYMNNYQADSFIHELHITDERNEEGFILYKRIFAHISDNEPITSIDDFISVSDQLHRLRNYLKDGCFETAIRHMEIHVKPIATGVNGLFPGGYETYRQWVREIALKYNSAIGYNCELVNSDFIGTAFEGMPFIDYIEQAPLGGV